MISTIIGHTISHYRIVEKLGGGGMGVVSLGPSAHQYLSLESRLAAGKSVALSGS